MTSNKKPLITFALVAYNQEQYIREALEGAFLQTYSPLEIILSDDHSDDQTFEIMRIEAEKHTVRKNIILNRNSVNLGLAGHINKVMELASGELVVIAAGDDVSLPERTVRIVDAYRKSCGTAFSIHSSLNLIDQQGNFIRVKHCQYLEELKSAVKIAKKNPWVMGAGHAWHKSVFEKFPPLNQEIIHEDRAIPFRSALIGEVIYLDEPLVNWRQGSGITAQTAGLRTSNDELYGVGYELLLRFKADALQKHDDAYHLGRIDLLVLLAMELQKLELSLMFAKRELGLIDIIKYSFKSEIGFFVFLKQLLKYKTPVYRFTHWLRNSRAKSRF